LGIRTSWLVNGIVVLTLALGGGTTQGLWSDALLQLASLPLLAFALRAFFLEAPPGSGWPTALLAACVMLPILQLIPLPPEWWVKLPGREPIGAAYDAVGMARPWLPLSLTPAATWRSALSLLPAVAVFLATVNLVYEDRRRLVLLILVIVLLSVLVDILQIIGGHLYFYEITNFGSAVGFFANRNHNAAFLYSAIPLAAAWGLNLPGRRPQQLRLGMLIVGLVAAGAALSLALTASRAGIVLGLVAGIVTVALVARHGDGRRQKTRLLIAVGSNLAALILAFQFGFVTLSERVQHSELIEDMRVPVASITIKAAETYSPVGSGLGSFVPIFQEREPLSLLASTYVNHAHDDWLELWLDGGVPALALAGAFLLWFARSTLRVWLARVPLRMPVASADFARAGSVVILLLLLHSIVDYPLRTTTLMVLFACCSALLIAPPQSLANEGQIVSPRNRDMRRPI
jgi:O-Antigen ligase